MVNQSVKVAYGYVKQWITVQRDRIERARERDDHVLADILTAELHRRLSGGKR